jgi:maltose alpha-D-glucosyltransferase/alpha-amylase
VSKLLEQSLSKLPEADRGLAERAAHGTREIDKRLKAIIGSKLDVLRIRCHGDYHLGQVLYTGKDFCIIDFEGEPGREIAERRFKRCALKDVAGMVRSLNYASVAALRQGPGRSEDVEVLRHWAEVWYNAAAASYLRGYFERVKGEGIVPPGPEDKSLLLDFYLLEKCLYELEYELNNRPAWVGIPLRGLVEWTEGGT